jgi:type IV fimbrial biogenesis protein FimT
LTPFTAPQQRVKGFTLLELLVAIAVLAIVAAIAVPSFTEIVRQNRATNLTNSMVSALNLARSEAVKRGAQASVSALESGWETGWQVRAGGNELRRWPTENASVTPSATTITFNPRGRLAATSGIQITVGVDTALRCVRVSLSGSARVAEQRGTCDD